MDKKRLNICFVIPFPPPYGGIANWSLLLKTYLDSERLIDYTIVDISPKRKSMRNINFFTRIVSGGFRMFRIKQELKRVIKKQRPNVIHLTTSGGYSLVRDKLLVDYARKKGIPIVYHIRYGRVASNKKNNNWEWKITKSIIKKVSCTIAIDNETFKCLNGELDGLVYQLPNPFDENKIRHLQKKKALDSKTVLFAGWVIKEKGIEELLSAWEMINKQFPEYNLAIYGPVKDNYMEFLKKNFLLDHVTFYGEVDNKTLLEKMNDCEIFVLPSHTEGFPNVVLEAMALSKPIIATKVGALPEMLSDRCGLLIEKQSINELANSLKTLFFDKRLKYQIAKNARKKLESDFLISKVFIEYMNIWKIAMGENNAL